MALEQDVKDSIEKNLPSVIGEVLKKRLLKADSDAEEIVQLKASASVQYASMTALNDQVKSLKRELEAHPKLDDRERAVAQREIAADMIALNNELNAEKRISKAFESAMAGLVRNTEWRERNFSSMPVAVSPPMTNGYQSGDMVQQHQTSADVTKSAT